MTLTQIIYCETKNNICLFIVKFSNYYLVNYIIFIRGTKADIDVNINLFHVG